MILKLKEMLKERLKIVEERPKQAPNKGARCHHAAICSEISAVLFLISSLEEEKDDS